MRYNNLLALLFDILSYTISVVKWFFFKFRFKKYLLHFFAEFELLMFHYNIVKISEKFNKQNLLTICLQVNYSMILWKLTLVQLNLDMPGLLQQCRSRSEEANWFGSAPFVIQYINLYQQPESSKLIGWKLKVAVAFNLFSMIRVIVNCTMIKDMSGVNKKKLQSRSTAFFSPRKHSYIILTPLNPTFVE